jgi:hypothetical protein
MPNPEEMISEFEDQMINGLELIEGLSRYDSWILEIDKLPQGGFVPRIFEDEDKKIFFNLYSKLEYYEYYHDLFNENLENISTIQVKGYWIFQNLPKGLDYLTIDPEREHNINYKKEQFELLMEMAGLVEFDIPIQKWLVNISKTNSENIGFQKLISEKMFFVVQNEKELPLAPDNKKRKIFPVFASRYAAERFILFLKGQNILGNYTIESILGSKLFISLKKMDIDGFVFNCLGPISPRAFQKNVLELL